MGLRPCLPLRIQVLCLLEAQLQTSLNIFVKRDLALAFVRLSGRAGRDPARHVPGSCVGPVDPLEAFVQLVHEVFRCPRLGPFLRSCFRKAEPGERSGGPSRAPGEGSWPMPLPYPEVFAAEPKSLAPGELKKLVVNIQICLLNYLDLGRPSRAPSSCISGGPLSDKQWEAVKRFVFPRRLV